jgi:biotin operon repressor
VGSEIDPVAADGGLGGLGGKIPVQAWRALLANGMQRRYVKGEVLVRQGEPGGYVCVTYIVPHLSFRRIVEEFGLGNLVLRHLTDRLRESEEMRSELAGLSPRRRIARLLLRFSQSGELALSQEELARAVGLSRSAAALELAWLRDHGLVATSRGRVLITDRPGLLRLADDIAAG